MGEMDTEMARHRNDVREAEAEAVAADAASLRRPAPDAHRLSLRVLRRGGTARGWEAPVHLATWCPDALASTHLEKRLRCETEDRAPRPRVSPSPRPNGICTDIIPFSPAVDLGPHAVFPHTLKGCACPGWPWAAPSSLPDGLPTAAPPHRGGHSLLAPLLLWDIAPESVPRSQVAFTKGQTPK